SREKRARQSARDTETAVVVGSLVGAALLAGAVAATAREAAARRKAENVLRFTEERQRLLFEGLKDHAIFMLDPEGRILTWSEGARRLHGYSAEEVTGRSHAMFYPAEAVEAGVPEEFLGSARLDGRAENDGWRVRKDGSRFWADAILTALRSDDRIVGF